MNEKQSKQPNRKNNKKDKGNKVKETYPSIQIIIHVFFTCLFCLSLPSSYYIYKFMFEHPELPKVDMNEYWGQYPMELEPDLSIRHFKIEFSDVMIHDLRERLLHRRPFVPPLENAGFTYGFNTHFLTKLLDYWQNKYNFKEREQFFNKYNHYKTNIQGLDIHYIHVKPKVTDNITVVPLLMMHGWPGSVREFYELIPKLTTPVPEYDFVFELIIPSMPGFGFSQAAVRPGLSTNKMAVVMANLMKRIGHKKYYVQGGDIGHSVGSAMATLFPDKVLGFHTNFPTVLFNKMAQAGILLASWWPSLIVEEELSGRLYPLQQHAARLLEESGYMHIQATKPDTIGAALTDSPAGLAAYILEKFSTWTNPKYKMAGDGNLLNKFSLTQLLDNVIMYWVSNCITTSLRTYAETLNKNELSLRLDEIPTSVPTWGIKFKHELVFHPDWALRLKYKNYLHSTLVEEGGHFAALELPHVLAADIYQAVHTFTHFHNQPDTEETIEDLNYEKATTVYDFTVKDINGNNVKLDKYKGHVLIIVNVASECGLTDTNYKELNELYEKYSKTKKLRILAFPCNQFAGQEPGNNEDILSFVRNRGVKFDLFEKIDVNGENAHPLFKFLKKTQTGTFGDYIKWNFSKFIIDKNGIPVERLGPNVNPINLEPLLANYW